MMNSINGLDGTQELLIKLLEQNPDDWGMRKKVVWFLYEAGYFREASKVVWNAPEIPPLDKEIIFAARIVSKGQPTRAMRLLNAVVERNRVQPEKNLEMAKELVRGGMPLQAARFYGAATLSDSSLIDEDFEVCLITADADEEDWNLIVQSEEFPWDGPLELTEADLACDEEEQSTEDAMLSGLTQPVPLKAPVKSMQDTVNDEEKSVDLRKDKKPLPLNPDKISTKAVTMSILNRVEEDEKVIAEEVTDEEVTDEEVIDDSKEVIEDLEAEVSDSADVEDISADQENNSDDDVVEIESLSDHIITVADEVSTDDAVQSEDDSDEVMSLDDSEEEDQLDEPDEPDESVAAKKGVLSSLMGFFRRSKTKEVAESDADIFSAPVQPASVVQAKPMIQSITKPAAITSATIKPVSASSITPIVGPVKPKAIPIPAKVEGVGGRKYGQPQALDCRTRLVALAPQDGTAFFNELTAKYAKFPSGKVLEVVTIARDEADMDYMDIIEKACSNDKSVNLDSFSQLLGLHAAMTEADCDDWVEDMNFLRQGFGDAVLATVVSKYSVSECRDILGAVYRRVATKAAV